MDDAHIFRDRNVFTKSVLRSFIKKTVTREAWTGAPWLVKHDVADQYRIDTRIPPHLRYDNKLLERKQIQAAKRLSQTDLNGTNGSPNSNGPLRLPELKPAPKSHKSKLQPSLHAHGHKGKSNVLVAPEPGQFMAMPIPGNPFQFPIQFRSNGAIPPPLASYSQPEPPAPPPLPKYPIEDLQLEPRDRTRPQLAYLCSDAPAEVPSLEPKNALGEKLLMKSIGPLLETWDTLNVYCEIFKLDSFTFDDYVEAMQVASEEVPVQLFDEIHCAVLKILVNSEDDGGKVQIQLPELDDDDEEEEDDEEEDSQVLTPEPEPQPTARATRGSLAKREAERLAAELAQAEREAQEALDAPKHRAEEVLDGYDWIEQLRKRDLSNGGLAAHHGGSPASAIEERQA